MLPTKGPLVDTKKTFKWTQRVMSLTSYDIRWKKYMIGTTGCINYNLVLVFRQLGYALNDQPLHKDVEDSVFFYKLSDLEMLNPQELQEIQLAWTKIHRKNEALLGRKDVVAKIPYIMWIMKRVENLLLPYSRERSLCEQAARK